MPIFLITVFAKNEKANLSKAEQAAAVEMSKTLVAKYGDGTSLHMNRCRRAWKRRWHSPMATCPPPRFMRYLLTMSMWPKFANELVSHRPNSLEA